MAKNRSLQEAQQKLNRRMPVLDRRINRMLENRGRLNVLEVAFGEGRALLELAAKYRDKDIRFYGVEKKTRPRVNKREDLQQTIERYGILLENEISRFTLPEIFFYDAQKLHFDDESMDIIYSVVAIRFFDRKAEFLEEICRVLKPKGTAFLHIGESDWQYPYSRVCDDWLLTPVRNRFILKYKDELIPLPAYLQLFHGEVFGFRFINKPRCVLRIQKKKSAKLDLQLTFNDKYSNWLRTFPYGRITGESQGGFRSVYDLDAGRYAELFEKGLLAHDELQKDVALPEFLLEKESA
ncbi:MAG: class I SAM-dependent methyltransferase [bacterium]